MSTLAKTDFCVFGSEVIDLEQRCDGRVRTPDTGGGTGGFGRRRATGSPSDSDHPPRPWREGDDLAMSALLVRGRAA